MSLLNTQSNNLEKSIKTDNEIPSWEIKLLYDGQCPLCMREVNFLKKRDGGRGLVAFVDIAEDDYDAEANGGIDFEAAMGRIHGILADGTIIKNVEVFRRVYEVLGMGWVYAVTKLPIIGTTANAIYSLWAEGRFLLTGRPNLATIVKQRQERLLCNTEVSENRCRLEDK
jgi:predicted DCC family thiol-disulfide oxidoreductase YuxK